MLLTIKGAFLALCIIFSLFGVKLIGNADSNPIIGATAESEETFIRQKAIFKNEGEWIELESDEWDFLFTEDGKLFVATNRINGQRIESSSPETVWIVTAEYVKTGD